MDGKGTKTGSSGRNEALSLMTKALGFLDSIGEPLAAALLQQAIDRIDGAPPPASNDD